MPTTKRPPSKPRRPSLTEAKLVRENNDLRRERDGSLEREAATSEILRMIASSPAELQRVLDAMAERAAKLCDAEDAAIFRVDGNSYRRAAHLGRSPWQLLCARAVSLIAICHRVERLPTGRRSMSLTFKQPKLNSRVPRPVESQWAFARCSLRHCSAKA